MVADAAAQAGWCIAGVCDDAAEPVASAVGGHRRLGGLSLAFLGARLIALGSIAARRRIIGTLTGVDDDDLTTIVHPRSVVSPRARVDAGGFVGAAAVIQPFAVIARHAIINTGAIVEHECELGENVHIAPGAVLAGNVRIGADTLVGIGARVLPGVRIGRGCTIGAGAVVVKDVTDGVTVVGVPGRVR